MTQSKWNRSWGEPPWTVNFRPAAARLPETIDFAVIGGGFTGLATAAWLRKASPRSSVALFEAGSIGAGASGRTGGMALAETAAGDLPGLGDVLAGFEEILKQLAVDCDLQLPGAWELGRGDALVESPIAWTDSGSLRAAHSVPGGAVDPGLLVAQLAGAAERLGARIFERCEVTEIELVGDQRGGDTTDVRLVLATGDSIRARKVLAATNAMSLELSGLAERTQPKFTMAVATQPLSVRQLSDLGLSSGKPFYTIDFPYLWGRMLRTGGVVFGSGLVHMDDWRELSVLDIGTGQAAGLLTRLEARVRGLHPALQDVAFTHRWGGPILIPVGMVPVFSKRPGFPNVFVLGGYSGHGVALSVYLGRWAAEAMLGLRDLPAWTSE